MDISMKIKYCGLLIFFTLIHEIGHIIVGICFGMKPIKLALRTYGFKLKFKVNYKDCNKKVKKSNLFCIKKVFVLLAGPIMNLIICLIAMFIKGKIQIMDISITSQEIIYSNLIVGIFNLIPIYPLDGGKIVQEILHIFLGLRKSYNIVQDVTWISISIFTAFISILILYYRNIFILIVLIYLWYLVIKSEKEIILKEKIYKKIEKIRNIDKQMCTGKDGKNAENTKELT